MDTASIREILDARFDSVDLDDDTCVFQAESCPFGQAQAICFIDLSRRVADSDFNIDEYQEGFLSDAFYSRNDPTRWNLYLLLLCDQKSYEKLLTGGKALEVERNEFYGRKFVLPDEQLEELLGYIVGPAEVLDAPRPTSNVSDWRDKLAELGLPPFPESSPPSRIVGDYIDRKLTPTATLPLAEWSRIPPPPFIEQIAINGFRACLENREYRFGAVNLIVGENGVGKTSLLEAIEHWVCGRNRRSPTRGDSLDIRILFRSDPYWHSSRDADPSTLRNRSGSWYGIQPSPPGNPLPYEFSRFNFYDVDAAVRLMTGAEGDITSQYADRDVANSLRLLIEGGEVWKLEESLGRIQTELRRRRTGLVVQERAHSQEIADTEKQARLLEQSTNRAVESKRRLNVQLERLGIHRDPSIKAVEEIEVEAVAALAALEEAGRVFLPSVRSTLEELQSLAERVGSAYAESQKRLRRWHEIRSEIKRLEEIRAQTREKNSTLDAIARYLKAPRGRWIHLFDRLSSIHLARRDLIKRVVKLSKMLDWRRFGLMTKDLGSLRESTTLVENSLRSQKHLVMGMRETLIAEHESASDREAQLLKLARELVSQAPRDTTCPVCGTAFRQSDLESSILFRIKREDQPSSGIGDLDMRLAKLTASESRVNRFLQELELIAEVESDLHIPFTEPLHAVIHKFQDISEESSQLVQRRRRLKRARARLSRSGLSADEWNSLLDSWLEFRKEPEQQNPSLCLVEAQASELSQRLEEIKEATSRLAADASEAARHIASAYEPFRIKLPQKDGNSQDPIDPEKLCSYLFDLSTESEIARDILETQYAKFQIDPANPCSDLREKLRATQEIIQRARSESVGIEVNSQLRQDNAKRLATSRDEREALTDKLERIQDADVLIKSLLDRSGQQSEDVDNFLRVNRIAIGTLMRALCVPRDFSHIEWSGKRGMQLIRRVDSEPCSLREISAGQRAALALSVFLCMNASLGKAGPPYILLDEPIANIDELNTLSFFDYLRALSLNDTRQIFFATADHDIAALFQRKFAFMGTERFRTVELERAAESIRRE